MLVALPGAHHLAQTQVSREGVLDPGEFSRGRQALTGGGVAGGPRARFLVGVPVVLQTEPRRFGPSD